MNLREKWGNLYPGFMLMSGGEIHLTKEKNDYAMDTISKRYAEHQDQLNEDFNKFNIDLKKEEISMKPTSYTTKSSSKRPISIGVGEKLKMIWK